MPKMSDSDEERLVGLLKQLEPGFLPYDVFAEIARIVVLPIIEFIPLRLKGDNQIEVLLLARDKDDPFWPGMVHTPGTVIRATDKMSKMYLAFERILQDELHDTSVGDPYYIGSVLHESKRGMEQAQLFWVEVIGKPSIGEFYDVNDLPDNLINSQIDFIKQATKSFQAYKVKQ